MSMETTMKYKPYPAYKDSGVEWLGEVPEHWEILSLRRIASLAYGDSLAEEIRVEGEVPVFGSNGRVGWHCDSNTKEPLIIIGRKGSFGKVTYSEKAGFCIDTTYFIDSRYSKANLRWLYYAMQPLGLDEISQDTGVPGLSREKAYEKRLTLPSGIEQHTIAAFLDRETAKIDTLIAKQERLIELLGEKRTALISHAVTKGLNPGAPMKDSGVEWLGEVPEHWEVIALKRIASLKSGETINSDSIEETGDFPVFGGNGLRGYTTSYTHEGTYALIGRQGALCGNINYTTGKFWASEHAVVVSPVHAVKTNWLGELLRAMNLNQYSISAAQPGLSVEIVGNLFIPFPPSVEQQTIADFLDRETAKIDTLMAKARRATDLLKERRTALISAAVTGKIDVRNAA